MVAAGKSSMRGWCSFHLPGVSLRGQSRWRTEQLLNGQPGYLAVVLLFMRVTQVMNEYRENTQSRLLLHVFIRIRLYALTKRHIGEETITSQCGWLLETESTHGTGA